MFQYGVLLMWLKIHENNFIVSFTSVESDADEFKFCVQYSSLGLRVAQNESPWILAERWH